MNRLIQHAMTAERQTTQNETTPAANEGEATGRNAVECTGTPATDKS